MANEIRISSVGQLGADDDDAFAIKVVDENGAVVSTPISVDPATGAVSVGTSIDGELTQEVTPDDSEGADVNVINPGVNLVEVGANVNDVNDFIVLPALADVPVGHTITVVSNAAGHEVRTPASSNEKINNQDSDGTKEYAIAAGSQVHIFRKISDSIGWVGQGFTALGAVVTAVVPD